MKLAMTHFKILYPSTLLNLEKIYFLIYYGNIYVNAINR